MNRQQKRKDVKTGNVMTYSEHIALMQFEGRRMLNKAVNDYSAALCLVLRDELRFGNKRAQRFLSKIAEIFDDITDNRLNIEDVKQTIFNEIGVKIK